MKLETSFKMKVLQFLSDQRIKDVGIKVVETLRSDARQKELIESGASKVDRSNHQDGKAFDYCFSGNIPYPSDITAWQYVSDIATEYGMDCGLKLWGWDFCHIQDNFLPVIDITMNLQNEFHDNSFEIVKLANSNLWKATTNEDLRKRLESMNAYLRTMEGDST